MRYAMRHDRAWGNNTTMQCKPSAARFVAYLNYLPALPVAIQIRTLLRHHYQLCLAFNIRCREYQLKQYTAKGVRQ